MTPTNIDNAALPPERLTPLERRWLWGASGLFLLILLMLFFTGLFTNIRSDHPFVAGFYYISEVIAACSAGIIASTITGFFKIELDKKIGSSGRALVQASGGFAVFLLVMYLGPRQKMQDLSSLVFSHLISDCKSALTSTSVSSQSRALCVQLTETFPSRPEVWELLGRLDHIRSSHQGAQSAVANFAQAIERWALPPPTTDYGRRYSDLSKRDSIEVSELLRLYAYARGDVLVSMRQSDHLSDADYELELTRIVTIVQNAVAIAGDNADPDFISDTHDILGKLYFYRHYQLRDNSVDWLVKAKNEFRQIVDLPDGCNVWPRYHFFLVSTAVAAASSTEPCTADLDTAFKDFVGEIGRCAVIPGLDSNFWTAFKFLISGVFLYNDREETAEITAKLGSRQYGGPAVAAFAHCNPQAVTAIRQLLSRL
ncbi:hypothetical protein SAMN05216337_103317 [Bradyrhizobium brasilense]|uniref:Uncharacterized protein n=1 Tax=Bradyrhizobium brasilense TaxID=1419277 RepID=A0A1G7F7Y0_9BRAD|nr:hypothetical protein [Bradyrhizobium brasilense]SDE72017.1 hypothetical protein SAMN05216337_103317 [Bradyrhizobium brasilense]